MDRLAGGTLRCLNGRRRVSADCGTRADYSVLQSPPDAAIFVGSEFALSSRRSTPNGSRRGLASDGFGESEGSRLCPVSWGLQVLYCQLLLGGGAVGAESLVRRRMAERWAGGLLGVYAVLQCWERASLPGCHGPMRRCEPRAYVRRCLWKIPMRIRSSVVSSPGWKWIRLRCASIFACHSHR